MTRWAAILVLATAVAAADRPNIVFFLIDDLGWKDVGYMGGDYRTPQIDRLARSGMVFTRAYANGPNCAPSRACLLSGLYAPRHGVYTVGKSARGKVKHRKLVPIANKTVLDDDFVTLAEALKGAGYATATMGKWHLGPDPTTQGFDRNVGGNRSGSPRGGYFSPYKNPQLENGPKGEYLTDRLTDEALRFLAAHQERPFFLYLTYYAVHTPIQPKPDLVKDGRRYAAMVEGLDGNVGRVLAKLDELKLADRTVVCFFSDNGGHGPVTSMAPLRGAKGMLYEGGIRVPMIVRWPGKTKAGSRTDVPVIGTDFFPTLAAIAGATPPAGLDGVNLAPLLTGAGRLPERALFWHFPAYLQKTRGVKGAWRTTPAGAIRMGDFKLIEFFEDGRLELYDTRKDLGETTNLAAEMPEKTKELHAALRAWRKATNAPVPTKRNPAYQED